MNERTPEDEFRAIEAELARPRDALEVIGELVSSARAATARRQEKELRRLAQALEGAVRLEDVIGVVELAAGSIWGDFAEGGDHAG